MEIEQTLSQLLADPQSPVDPQWVLSVIDAYPTFYLPALLLLQRNPHDADPELLQRLQTLVALNCPDREALADFLDISGGDWAHLFPTPVKPRQKTTDETITDFIATYGHSSDEEISVLENLIFNPVPTDYFQGTDEPLDPNDPLAIPPELIPGAKAPAPAAPPSTTAPAASPAPPVDTIDNLENIDNIDNPDNIDTIDNIDNIEPPLPPQPAQPAEPELPPQKPHQKHKAPAPTPDASPDAPLQLSLAKMYIKQKKYSRAYEIISTLSLNYPEKSIYFADQLRFLQKLMLIQEHTS